MYLETLRGLAREHRNDPNYQHKNLDDATFLRNAVISFQRLPETQQSKVIKSWQQTLGKMDDLTNDELYELVQLRYLAQTNLFFLCKLLEKYNQTTVKTHEDICNAFFVRKDPTFTSFEHFATQYSDLKKRMLLVPRNGFKALDLNTLIPTPEGMVSLEDIKIGDKVFGSDGKVCNVVGVSEVFYNRDCYSVNFSSGESIIADADHLWITDSRKDRDRLKGRKNKNIGPKPSIKTTKEIKDTIEVRGETNHRVAVAGSLQTEHKELSISPYVLGCWLGDGTSSNSNLTCNDYQIVTEIQSEGQVIRKSDYDSPYLYVMNGGEGHKDYRKHSTNLASQLRNIGVLNNKHIPESYLFSSHDQRLSLLQGLMDTDGTCDERGQCYFSNTNKTLAIQVRQLIASLGLKPFDICEFETYYNGKYCGQGYQVGFKSVPEINVFRLDRKKQKQAIKRAIKSKYRHIVSVDKVETRPTKCIMVDSEDHTYLVGSSFIPTHNSSIDMADCVQYIICWPAITILILTGTLTLATDFVGEIKQHFTLEETGNPDPKTGKSEYGPRKLQNRETGEWSDSLFQVLFPEHCTTPKEGKQTEFQTAAGGDDKEPTIRAASIEQALSGAHFGVMKLDDVVTNENSLNVNRMDNVNKQIGIDLAMLNPYGFVDFIGTWYDERDYYGKTIKQQERYATEQGLSGNIRGSIDSGVYNSDIDIKIYLRSAWVLKPGVVEDSAKAEDFDLWFPERMSYDWLKGEQRTDEDTFIIKYINNPRKRHNVKFPRELLVARTIPHSQLPPQGVIVTAVDTAYSTKNWADFTVIVTGLIFGGRFYIINMVRGRFNEYELPQVIASVAYKWKPKRIAIEDSVGVKWMGRELRREMDKLQISVPVEYCSLGLGSKANSKKIKAKPVLRLLGDQRMYFLNSCEGLQEIYNELELFTGTPEDRHDDIVSALSLLVEQFIGWADMDNRVNYVDTQYATDKQAVERHNQIYCLGKYARFNSNQFAQDDNPRTMYQLEQPNGPWKGLNETPEVDPFAELMG